MVIFSGNALSLRTLQADWDQIKHIILLSVYPSDNRRFVSIYYISREKKRAHIFHWLKLTAVILSFLILTIQFGKDIFFNILEYLQQYQTHI